jgi:glycosyltransferase involved in cell wall biosynthesis
MISNNPPLISVIMPVYNESLFVEKAIKSVLNQSLFDFELLIIDDASEDNTVDLINEFNDDRIILIQKEKNTGYTDSLNLGIKRSAGRYIARMDGDDISHEDRFKVLFEFLENNMDYILCGSQYERIDGQTPFILPTENDEIKAMLLRGNQFIHPAVMMRKSVLIENDIRYNKDREPAEDYDLWVRLMPYGKFKNLNKPLLAYRIHAGQISQRSFKIQKEHDFQTRILYLNNIGVNLNQNERRVLENIYSTDEALSRKFLMKHYQSMAVNIRIGLMSYFNEFQRISKITMLIEKDLIKHRLLKKKDLMILKFFKYFIFRSKVGLNRSIAQEFDFLKLIIK